MKTDILTGLSLYTIFNNDYITNSKQSFISDFLENIGRWN